MKFLFTLAFLVATAAVVYAQPTLPSAPSQAPIDGGLSVVALAGGAYAWKKLRASKK
jgi:hypothetical protein